MARFLRWCDIAIPNCRDGDDGRVKGFEVRELLLKMEVLKDHEDARRKVDRHEKVCQDRLQLRGYFTLTCIDKDGAELSGLFETI